MPVLQQTTWHDFSAMMRSQHVPRLPILLHTLLSFILMHTAGRPPSLLLCGAAGRSPVRPASPRKARSEACLEAAHACRHMVCAAATLCASFFDVFFVFELTRMLG